VSVQAWEHGVDELIPYELVSVLAVVSVGLSLFSLLIIDIIVKGIL
jgi:hypothetical protein